MKKTFSLLAFLFVFCLFAPDGQAEIFEEANAGYKARQFKEAATLYEKIIDEGEATPEIYYNLANTYFRLDKKGQALVFYERAKKLLPRDKDIHWNIQLLKSTLKDRIQGPEKNITMQWVDRTLQQIAFNELCALLTILLLSIFLITFLNTFMPKTKIATGFLGGILIFGLILAAVATGWKWLDIKDPRVVILDSKVDVRYGPSERETKAFLLHEGAAAKVTDTSRDWLYIVLPNKNAGWIPKSACEVI